MNTIRYSESDYLTMFGPVASQITGKVIYLDVFNNTVWEKYQIKLKKNKN